MTTAKHKCCGRTNNGFYGSPCGKTAKVERNGKWFCGTHDPVAIQEKRNKRNAEWDAKWKASQKLQAEAAANRNEQERRAACFPELLEALKDAHSHIADDALRTRIGTLIVKAEGFA